MVNFTLTSLGLPHVRLPRRYLRLTIYLIPSVCLSVYRRHNTEVNYIHTLQTLAKKQLTFSVACSQLLSLNLTNNLKTFSKTVKFVFWDSKTIVKIGICQQNKTLPVFMGKSIFCVAKTFLGLNNDTGKYWWLSIITNDSKP